MAYGDPLEITDEQLNPNKSKPIICPLCKTENTDDWPIEVDGEIIEGGCQDCWETQCDKFWWEVVEKLGGI